MDFGDSRGAILATFQILGHVALWVHLTAVLAMAGRSSYARGTQGRYIFSTLYRAVALGGPILWMLNLVTDVLDESKPRWFAVLDAVFVGLTILQYYSWRNDDDDFWRGLGGRLKRRARSLFLPTRQVAFDR